MSRTRGSSPRRRERLALGGAALLYAALAVVAQRPLVRGLGDQVYDQDLPGNDCLLHAWTIAWDQHALATDPRHLVDANVFYPEPRTLLYSDHLLGLALPLAPLRLVTDNAVLLHNLATLAAPALDALALFALARDLTGRAGAALVGGFLYGFAPFRFEVDRCQLQVLAAWWLPLFFLFARRAVAEDRVLPGVVAGGTLALQGLTGIYLTAFLLLFLPVAHAWWWWRHPMRGSRRGWAALLLAEAAAFVALLPFSLAYRRVQLDLGVSRSQAMNVLLSLHPSELGAALPLLTLGVLFAAGTLLVRRAPRPFAEERGLHLVIALGALVLALGPAIPLPGGLGQVKGPYAGVLRIPGYDALRAPGRALRLALLGASVTAAGGLAALTRGLPAPATAAAVAVAIGAAILEYRPPAFAMVAATPPARRDPVYAWLAGQPPDLRFVELPMDPYQKSASAYQHASTAHWKRMVNGNSGLLPPLYPYLARRLERFPDDDVLALLRALDVDHVVVHAGVYLPAAVRARLAVMRADAQAPLALSWAHGVTQVLAIRDAAPAPALVLRGRRLERSAWRATASQAGALAGLALDADPESAWSNIADLERGLRERWYDPVPFAERWAEFTASQPTRLAVDLGASVAVTAVEVRLGGSDPLLAPLITLETSEDGSAWTPLAGGLDPLPDVRALVTRAAEARFALALPAPRAARFVRLVGPGLEWRVGDLEVYAE